MLASCIWITSRRLPAAIAVPAPVAAPMGIEVAPAARSRFPGSTYSQRPSSVPPGAACETVAQEADCTVATAT